jgi:hypothetical protein
MKKTMLIALAVAVLVLAFTACKDEPEHTHEWGAWQETTAPTITADGEETRTCATCGEKEKRTIAALATPFFGTWEGNGRLVIIKPNYFLQIISSDNYRIDNPVWTTANNTSEDTKDEYNSGYNLSGNFSVHPLEGNIGNPTAFSLFINASKTQLLWALGSPIILTKQGEN